MPTDDLSSDLIDLILSKCRHQLDHESLLKVAPAIFHALIFIFLPIATIQKWNKAERLSFLQDFCEGEIDDALAAFSISNPIIIPPSSPSKH